MLSDVFGLSFEAPLVVRASPWKGRRASRGKATSREWVDLNNPRLNNPSRVAVVLPPRRVDRL